MKAQDDVQESEPLFSAELEGGEGPNGEEAEATGLVHGDDGDSDGGYSLGSPKDNNHRETRFPPPKYLKSTYASREAEFELDPEVLFEGEEAELHGVPAMQGLMGKAANRGSIEVRRDRRSSQESSSEGQEELVVGGGQGSIFASVSSVAAYLCKTANTLVLTRCHHTVT